MKTKHTADLYSLLVGVCMDPSVAIPRRDTETFGWLRKKSEGREKVVFGGVVGVVGVLAIAWVVGRVWKS